MAHTHTHTRANMQVPVSSVSSGSWQPTYFMQPPVSLCVCVCVCVCVCMCGGVCGGVHVVCFVY